MRQFHGLSHELALFPDPEDRLHWDDFLSRALRDADLRVKAGSVAPTLDQGILKNELSEFDFVLPRSIGDVLAWVIAQMEHGIVHATNSRYFGLFNPAPAFPAVCADRITSIFNPQLASATTSPAAIEIENHTIRAVGRRMGFNQDVAGHFTTGGSEANYTALLCALTRANTGFATEGARAFSGPPVFYVSHDSHLAWIKIAHQAGIGRSAVRLIATDGHGRLNDKDLASTLTRDYGNGCVPVMIAATAGTTCAGAIDPLESCANVARQAGIWYHVDAAWGGALIASDRLSHLLKGIQLADSVTLDPHKWFATTMGCGMFISTHAESLPAAFGVPANFMPSSKHPERDPYLTTAQWSRRFVGLRLFMALATAGWSGYAQHVERAIILSGLLKDILECRGWKIANDPKLAVLCVEPPAGSPDARTIVNRVVASGKAWISAAVFEGRDVIRACVTHGETTTDDIVTLADAMDAAAQGIDRPVAVTALGMAS
jgi:glutamate/tyrosine decarboxylase-like PLP-dependent enzyme